MKILIKKAKRKTSLLLEKTIFNYNYPSYSKLPLEIKSDEIHLKAAMDWLMYAQDINKEGGVSACYYPKKKRSTAI